MHSTAVHTAFITGILIHSFRLTHVIHNMDNVLALPEGLGVGIESGRWMLQLLKDILKVIGFSYNLPIAAGGFFLACISLAAGLTAELYQCKNRRTAGMIAVLFVCFPTVSATMVYNFTLIPYGIGILLSVAAVWVYAHCHCPIIWSAICIAVSLGCYQGYLPLSISMFVVILLKETVSGKEVCYILKKGMTYAAGLLLGLGMYFVCLKMLLHYYQKELSDYRGINTMGQLNHGALPDLIREIYRQFFVLPYGNTKGIVSCSPLRYAYLICILLTVLLIVLTAVQHRIRLSSLLLTVILCAVYPIAVKFIIIMGQDPYTDTLVSYASVMVPCTPLILLAEVQEMKSDFLEKIRRYGKKCAEVSVIVLIFFYIYSANLNYISVYSANRQVEGYLNNLVSQVRMTEGFTTDKERVCIGEISDPMLEFIWTEGSVYRGAASTKDFLRCYSTKFWLKNVLGYQIIFADEEKSEKVLQRPEVQQMPCWPNYGSVKVMEDVIVIKFEDAEKVSSWNQEPSDLVKAFLD
ncbi:MAG: glucosyltransferase domain-containing protein [Eubacteriales bacterium]|nr:glucosyltransferase domain-containing protein [Eubacteriales bacterium]